MANSKLQSNNFLGDKLRKHSRLLAVIIGLTLLVTTSACVKLNLNLTVTSNDYVSGSVISAISKELSDYATETGQTSTSESLFPNSPKVTRTPYSDSSWVGDRYSFQSMPISEFNAFGDSSSALRITRVGNNLKVSGTIDMSSPDNSGDDSSISIDPGSLLDVKFVMTLPGKVISSSGVVTGNTITWRGNYGTPLQISAMTYSPKSNSPAVILPNNPRNLVITEISAKSVVANFEFPPTFTMSDLKKNGYLVVYSSTSTGRTLGTVKVSSLDGQVKIDGLNSISERKLTFRLMSSSKKIYSTATATLPAGPSTATAVTYKKGSLKNGQITLSWKYSPMNSEEAVSGFVIHVLNSKDKGLSTEFEILNSEARTAVIDGGFAKKTNYQVWIEPKLVNGNKAPASQILNLKL